MAEKYEDGNFDQVPNREHFTWEELEQLKDTATPEEYLAALWITYPSIWAEEFCADPRDSTKRVQIRDYQRTIMDDPSRRKIIRIGRQTGKTISIAVLATWEAFLFRQSKILIVCPRQTQVELIYKWIRYFIDHDNRLKDEVVSDTKQPNEITLKNGSSVVGLTVGHTGEGVRGQVANTLFVDEADYIPESAVEAVDPVTNSYKQPNIWLSSTPTGLRHSYYNKYYSRKLKPFHFPSSVSPDWTPEKEAMYRLNYSIAGYEHEFEAEWGTSETGVFARWAIESMPGKSMVIEDAGSLRQYSYDDTGKMIDNGMFKYIVMGVDWNKAKNGTRIVLCGIAKDFSIYVLKKERIDAVEFTQTKAVNRIIELNRIFKPNFIAIDVGYGSMQLEDLHLIGKKFPETGFSEKVIAVETGGSIDIKDIVTGEDRSTFVKPFFVESTVRFLERGMVKMPTEENLTKETGVLSNVGRLTLADQMLNYEIEYYTKSGRQVYGDTQDHDLDAFMFCIYALVVNIIKSTNLYHTLEMVQPLKLSGVKLLNALIGNNAKNDTGEPASSLTRSIFGPKRNTTKTISRVINFGHSIHRGLGR